MDAMYIEELRVNHRFIVDNIGDPGAVCDELLSLGILDENYIDKIMMKKPAPKAQTKELLYLLKFRGANAYERFITALKRSGNKHVADKLMEPEGEPEQPTGSSRSESVPIQSVEENSPIQETSPMESSSVQQTSAQAPADQVILTDVFKSWPEKECKDHMKCTDEEKIRLLSDPQVYRILEFPKKGFVVQLKCRPQKLNQQNFDACNVSLDNVMTFLDAKPRSGTCFARLVNKSSTEYHKNIAEMMDKNTEELKKAGYFMMFFLTCGPQGAGCGQVFDKDKQCLELGRIIDMVKLCEALKDKPKIFIVVTILDESITVPEPPSGRTVTDAREDQSSTNEDNLFVFHMYHGERHGAWRKDPSRDMWFMRAFCDVLHAFSFRLHLLELIEKMNELMSNAVVGSNTRDYVGEIKVVQKDIRKKLYFFPGITNQCGQQATS